MSNNDAGMANIGAIGLSSIDYGQYSMAVKLQRAIAKAYIFLLTFRMVSPFMFAQSIVGPCARSTDLILHLIGLSLIAVGGRERVNRGSEEQKRLLRFFIGMIIWFNISSFIMAAFIQAKYGNIGSDNAFGAVFYMAIYFLQYMFMVIYNREIFMLISKAEILSVLGKSITALLILGYIQLAVINSGGALNDIYDRLDFLDVLIPAGIMSKLSLTGSEGASAGTIIATLIMPYYFSKILFNDNPFYNFIMVAVWLPLLYSTYSSTAYITFSCCCIIFLFIYMFTKRHILPKMFILLLFIFLLIILLFPDMFISVLPYEVSQKINYLLFDKAMDISNGSTASRTIPFYMNFGAFSEYPVLGVGNGCQGYFYVKYFPDWAYNVPGSDVSVFLERSKNGIANAGVFTLSILSGYGIVGTALFIIYIFKSYRVLVINKIRHDHFYYIALLSWPIIIISGLQGSFEGNYLVWFMLSLQFIPIDFKRGFRYVAADKCDNSNDESSGDIKANT